MRLFVGLPVPPSDRFAAMTSILKERHPDLRAVPPESWHVTLRFLGEVESADSVDRVIAGLADAFRGQPRLPVQIQGLGTFPDPARARVVWAGVQADIAPLAAKANAATALYGEPPDPRPFHAHVTLGRFKIGADLRRDVHEHKAAYFAEGELARAVLFGSELTPTGPVYREVAEYQFL